MKISKIILCACLVFLSLTAAQSQTSKFPKTVPADLEIKYNEAYGLEDYHKEISISGNVLTFEEAGIVHRKSTFSARLSDNEVRDLYRLLIENRFNTIRSVQRRKPVLDPFSGNLEISFGKYSWGVSFGQNYQFGAKSDERFSAISQAIKMLVEQHRKSK